MVDRSVYMRKVTLLIIEDDPSICELIAIYAEKAGYLVRKAHTGRHGLDSFFDEVPDLVILDIMLPEMDGWEICREIRSYYQTPIIMLTGRGESYDKIKGLDLGADDYVVKPFDPKELMARVKAVLRRYNVMGSENEVLNFPSLIIDMNQYKVLYEDKEVTMPPKEIELLYYLASNVNRVLTRHQLLDQVWGYEYEGDPRTVDVHIKRIREKLTESNESWSLKTIRGIGYKFEVHQ